MAVSTPTYKVILIGEYGVGKSSLFRRFMNDNFSKDNSRASTIGLDSFSKEFSFGTDVIKVGT